LIHTRINYYLPGLKTAVKIDGVINNPSTVAKGWTLEIGIPWKSLIWHASGRSTNIHFTTKELLRLPFHKKI